MLSPLQVSDILNSGVKIFTSKVVTFKSKSEIFNSCVEIHPSKFELD